jgi:hypothetical protein
MVEDARPAMPWPLAIGIFILATISVTSVLVARYPVSSVPSMQVARATYLRPHDSFAAVFARLASRVDEDPAALHAIRHASLACASGVSGDWMRRRSVSASEKAFRHWQVVYCHGRSQQGWARAYEMGEWVDIRRRHPSWAWTTPEAPGYPPDLYAGLLRDAPPPDLRLCREEGDCANGLSTSDIVRKRYAPDEVAIIELLHRRMLQERRYYAQSQAGLRR